MKILPLIITKLRNAGAGRWPAISLETGLPHETIRKLAYGANLNPELATMQPLLDFFEDVSARRKKMPPSPARRRRTNAEIAADKLKAGAVVASR